MPQVTLPLRGELQIVAHHLDRRFVRRLRVQIIRRVEIDRQQRCGVGLTQSLEN